VRPLARPPAGYACVATDFAGLHALDQFGSDPLKIVSDRPSRRGAWADAEAFSAGDVPF
jgi:hypothetical protein